MDNTFLRIISCPLTFDLAVNNLTKRKMLNKPYSDILKYVY